MTGTQLLLIRHGESTWNAEGRIQGQADPPLSALGRRQAEAIAHRLAKLSIAALYTSSATRARATSAAIAAPHGLSPELEPALLELNLGAWQGCLLSDLPDEEARRFHAWEHDPATTPPPGGETLADAQERIAPVLERILETHTGTIVVVTHSIAARIALSYLLDANLRLVPRLRVKKASVTKLRVEHGLTVLERLSDTSHLRSLR